MRIAFVTETWAPSVDGIITRLRATITELLRSGHQVLVIAPRPPRSTPRAPLPDGMQVRTVPTIRFRFVYGGQPWGLPMPQIDRYLREFDPDVVHLVNPVLVGFAGAIAARRQRRALVASYHTNVADYAVNYRLSWIVPTLLRHLRRMHGWADLNLATSEVGRGRLAELGIDDVACWPPGVDLAAFRPACEPGDRDGGPQRVLYVGRLAAEKSVERLFPMTRAGAPTVLRLVGDGPARREIERAAGPAAVFTGTLTGAALAQAYRDADVFAFPSSTDTLGLVMMEALASGLPVVAVDSAASRALLAGCPAARLVPADGIDAGVRDLLASMPAAVLRERARAHAERWSWQRATEALVGGYEYAVARSAAKSQGRKGQGRKGQGPRQLSRPSSAPAARSAARTGVLSTRVR